MGWTRSLVFLMGAWVLLAGSDCGSPESDATCDDLYGDVAGYELCEQTGSSCTFYRNNRPEGEEEIACAAICVSRGALCLNAYDEGEPNVCEVGDMLCEDLLACEESPPCQVLAADSVCVCGDPSGAGGNGGMGGNGGSGDLGDSCESTADCDPNASDLGVFCCLEAAKCGGNLGECVEDCSSYSSGGVVGMDEDALCQDNSECGDGLFCCLAPDVAGNCDFALDQSCTCRNNP